MIKVDYICTKDINKVAKIHSNQKYINWNLKVVDNEYRFYPPIVIDCMEEDIDDFDFSSEDDDTSYLDDVLSAPISKDKKIPMFGELWENTTKFFMEDKFQFVGYLEETITEKKMHKIKKGMNCIANIEKYKNKKQEKEEVVSNVDNELEALFNTDNSYKAFKVNCGNNIISNLRKYKMESLDEKSNVIEELSKNISDKIEQLAVEVEQKLSNKQQEDIEILSL